MLGRLPSIRLRIVIAFGTCAALMAVIAITEFVQAAKVGLGSPFLNDNRPLGLCCLAAAGVLAAVYGGVHVHNTVCGAFDRQILHYSKIAETLDLSKRATPRPIKELVLSVTAFEMVLNRVEQAVLAVRISTDSVTTATREIAAGNMDLSTRTEEQAASLEETASSMTQITEKVRQSMDSARQANRLAAHAVQIADVGSQAVDKMIGSIEALNRSSEKVAEIIGLIESIAFQTNILALNAAVEAARAGDQGRGFAVVASEVRNLAQRSSLAAKEIRGLIESSVTMVKDGSKQAKEVGDSIAEVTQSITQVAHIIEEIAVASEEQSAGMEQINQAVAQIDDVTQRNAALVEQSAAAAKSLEDQTDKLTETISKFKIRDSVPAE
ncbi:methyl-accepting chemotaxis protein [Paraburkholderia sediminicola]